jgi:hypothetical protein
LELAYIDNMSFLTPDNIKGTLRISTANGNLGSGFYLWYEDKYMFLITAKHVLYDKIKGEFRANYVTIHSSIVRKNEAGDSYGIDLKKLNFDLVCCSKHDIAIILIAFREGGRFHPIDYCEGLKIEGNCFSVFIDKYSLKIEELRVAEEVIVAGFPTSINLYEQLGFDFNTPLVRKGIVSGFNFKNDYIIIDCELNYGNSGGPVTTINRPDSEKRVSLIGIASSFVYLTESYVNTRNYLRHDYAVNTGYSIVIPMFYVTDLIIEYLNSIKLRKTE